MLNKDKFARALANLDKAKDKLRKLADDIERYGEAAINAGIEGDCKKWTLKVVWEADELYKSASHIGEAIAKAERSME